MAQNLASIITIGRLLILCHMLTGCLSQLPALSLLVWSEKNESIHQLSAVLGDPSLWSGNSASPSVTAFPMPANSFVTQMSLDYADLKGFYVDVGGLDVGRHVGHITISAASLANSNPTSTAYVDYIGLSGDVGGMAADWTAKNLYWTDSTYNWIAMAPMGKNNELIHGTNMTAVLVTNTETTEFGGIAVYPQKGYMYWASYSSRGMIERATLSGENRQVLNDFNITRPRGLTLDFDTEKLYWVDSAKGTVETMNIDGTGKRTVYREQGSKLNDVTVYKQYLYVTEQNSNLIIILLKDSVIPSGFVKKINTTTTPYAIGVYAPDVQRPVYSSCPTKGCDHICVSQPLNTSTCLCSIGWNKNGTTGCTANSTILPPQFFYSGGSYIQSYPFNFPDRLPGDMDFHGQNGIVEGSVWSYHYFKALGINVNASKLYIGDTSYRSIYTLSLSLPNPSLVQMISGVNSIGGLTVDWINSHIYWTESTYGTLQVTDGIRQTILLDKLSSPLAIAVDPLNQKLYWAEYYNRSNTWYSTIWKGDLDAGNKAVYYNTSLGKVNALHIDYTDMRIYWSDGTRALIMSADMNGGNVKINFNDTGKELWGVTTYKNYVIFTDRDSGNLGIHAVKKTGKDRVKGIIRSGSPHDALDVITYDQSVQPTANSASSPCNVNNGGCDHLCMPRPNNGFQCVCSVGFTLSGTTTCTSTLLQDNFVILADPGRKEIFQISLDGSSYNAVKLGTDHDYPRAVAFDSGENAILWMDTDIIKRIKLDGTPEEIVYQFPDDAILQRMAIDVSNRLLFITDDGRLLIGVLDLVGKNFHTIIDNELYRPRDIELDPWENRIYWADWGSTESINRAYYDGSGREMIVSTYLYFPFGLSIDIPQRKIMWVEGWYEEVEAASLDGSNRQTIYSKPSSFFHGLAISDSYLYFTDTWTRDLHRIPKEGAPFRADTKLIPGVLASAIDLHVHQSASEYKPNAACANSQCSHICLLTPTNGTMCACPDGVDLKDDKINCANVVTCPKTPILNGIWSPACLFRSGLSCDFICDTNYRKKNSSQRLTCGANGQWDSTDVAGLCEEIPKLCPVPVVTNGRFASGCRNLVGESCAVVCDTGYAAYPRDLRVLCAQDMAWVRDLTTVCRDITPPRFENCPGNNTYVAESGRLHAYVTWPQITAIDSESNAMVRVVGSVPSRGSWFGEGRTVVTYSAVDVSGNLARCTFTVTVTVERCIPRIATSTAQVLHDSECARNTNFLGARCYFKCVEGYEVGNGNVQGYFECTKSATATTKRVQWTNSVSACKPIPTKDPATNAKGDASKLTNDNGSGTSVAESSTTPAIVGIVVAALLILIVIGVIAFFMWRRMKRGETLKNSQFRYVNHSNEVSEVPGDPNYATIPNAYNVDQPGGVGANGHDSGIANPLYDKMHPAPQKTNPGDFSDLSQQAVLDLHTGPETKA